MGFSQNLKRELSYSGIMIKELSALSGVNSHALTNYVSRRGHIPSVETGAKIARALGVSVEFLVSGEDAKESKANAEIRAIIRMVKLLPGSQRKFIIDLLKLLAKRKDI